LSAALSGGVKGWFKTAMALAASFSRGPCKLFVGGISAQTTTEVLHAHFTQHGRLVDAVVMAKNGRPRGFGFVTFSAPGPALTALSLPQWIDGRLVDVKLAVPGEDAQERPPNKIFVGGLPQDVDTEALKAYFGAYGFVADAVVMVDRRTNRSRGFGFVRFANGAHGSLASEAVLMDFASHRLAGKWVEVKRATPAAELLEPTDTAAGFTSFESFTDISGPLSLPASTTTDTSAALVEGVATPARSHARGRRRRPRAHGTLHGGSSETMCLSGTRDDLSGSDDWSPCSLKPTCGHQGGQAEVAIPSPFPLPEPMASPRLVETLACCTELGLSTGFPSGFGSSPMKVSTWLLA